jgi:uncharacterized protein (TIGR02646 family)
MIFATRNSAPASLDGGSSVGGKERQKAIDFFADPANGQKNFNFKAYKRPDVIVALEEMFGHKCAYCESDYGAVAPTDIEHYRPKGAVMGLSGKAEKPGYYWLAAEWSNLLPSCIDCNRARRHEYGNGPELSGKANHFPLLDESKRASAPNGEVGEEPLLLNPTLDDPDEHLEFLAKGLVRPAQPQGTDSVRGKATIDILGLRRHELVRLRRTQQVWIDDAIASFKEAAWKLSRAPNDTFARNVLKRAVKNLLECMDAASPYACMARQQIQPVLDEVGIPPAP